MQLRLSEGLVSETLAAHDTLIFFFGTKLGVDRPIHRANAIVTASQNIAANNKWHVV